MKKSKDVTAFRSKKEMFDLLNEETDIQQTDGDDYANLNGAQVNNDTKSRNEPKSEELLNFRHTVSTAAVTGENMGKSSNFAAYSLTKIIEEMIEPSVDPKEWMQECDRVEKKLLLPIQHLHQGDMQEFNDRHEQVVKHL